MNYFTLAESYLRGLHNCIDLDVTSIINKDSYILVNYNYDGGLLSREREAIELFDLLNFIYSKLT